MTTGVDLAAITLTVGAKNLAETKGQSADMLRNTAALQIVELKRTLATLVAAHPGGDANLTALNAITAALA